MSQIVEDNINLTDHKHIQICFACSCKNAFKYGLSVVTNIIFPQNVLLLFIKKMELCVKT